MLLTIIPRSIRILRNNTGIVIFVGKAARLVTRLIVIAPMANAHKNMLFPESITAINVTGVTKQPCPAKPVASHIKRFFSCPLHQVIKRDHSDAWSIALS
jgi:hypothetical protein